MSAYEQVDNNSDGEHDGGNSVASSIEAPPFALGHDDGPLMPDQEEEEGEPRNLHPSEEMVGPCSELAASSVTTEGHVMQSSANSQFSQQSRALNTAAHVTSSHSSQQHSGFETFVFDGTGSSLMSSSQPMLGSSHLPGSAMSWNHDSTTHSHGGGSLDFSTLMRQADDRNQSIIVQSRMPTLEESTEEVAGLIDSAQTPLTNSSNQTPRTTNHSANNWLYSLFHGNPQKHHISAVPMMTLSPSYLEDPHTSVPGRHIQATRLGENMFEVSMIIDPPSTARDVMDVVANPDLLRLWCDPIKSLVITKSSEGALSATNRGGANREYEGEWIEATTSTLISPSQHNSYLYSLGQLIYNSLGFPSYGKITLFVERLRGQVGLTIGPFSGGIVASHTIKIQDDGPVVSVVDQVRLRQDEESCVCCCGLFEPVKRCLMPGLAGHIEQVLSSMMRLRALVEHGETVTYAANHGVGYDEEHGASSIPLLS